MAEDNTRRGRFRSFVIAWALVSVAAFVFGPLSDRLTFAISFTAAICIGTAAIVYRLENPVS